MTDCHVEVMNMDKVPLYVLCDEKGNCRVGGNGMVTGDDIPALLRQIADKLESDDGRP